MVDGAKWNGAANPEVQQRKVRPRRGNKTQATLVGMPLVTTGQSIPLVVACFVVNIVSDPMVRLLLRTVGYPARQE